MTDAVANAVSKAGAAGRSARLGAGIKITTGAGQLIESVTTTIFGTFLFFFYTALLGLPGSLVGAATAISLVIDAIADPLLGSWSDNTRTRWGRRVPFMLIATPVVALGVGLLFSPPHGLPTMGIFAWLVATSLMLRFAVSSFHVPFIALGAEMSQDYAERSSIVAFRSPFSIFGPLLVLILGYGVFLSGPEGVRRIEGYAPMAWSAAILIGAGGLISVLGVRKFAAGLPVAAQDDAALHLRLARELKEIFSNPSFRVLFACGVLFYAAQGVVSSFGQYMNLFVWKITSAQILLITLCLFAGLLVGVPLAPVLAKRMEKRGVLILGLVMLCLAQGGLAGLRALHIFTLSGAAVVGPLGANSFFAGVGLTCAGIAIASMMADAADEHDFLFSARREGLYFAGLGFAGKAATGLGALVAGVELDAIRFPHVALGAASSLHIAPSALDSLAVLAGPVVAVGSLVATSLLFFYRIDSKRHAEVMAELNARADAKV